MNVSAAAPGGRKSSVAPAASFAWRGGHDRQTTGVWIWSEPFQLRRKKIADEPPIFVLLMDTQG